MRKVPEIDSPFLVETADLPRDVDGFALWDEVFEASRPLRVEVGVGNSPFLIEVASLEPEFNYLGLEYSGKRVLKFLKKVHRSELENIRMLRVNADRILRHFVPKGRVNHVFVNFPDPWHKRRHGKKRFVNARNAELVSTLLAEEGGFSLRTDVAAYAHQMLEVLDECRSLVNVYGSGRFADRPLYEFATPYELRFKEEGLPIYYLEYRRAQNG